MTRMTCALACALALGGCATTGGAAGSKPAAATEPTAPAATATPAAPATTAKTPAATGTATASAPTGTKAAPGDAKALLRQSIEEVEKGRLDEARALFERARPLAGADRQQDLSLASTAIAVFSNQGDYEAAARVLLDLIRRRAGDPANGDLFILHNWMAILREAEGDLPAAILECAERTAVGYEGTWEPAAERLQQTRFKDDWHRAYLFRMYAEQLSGTRREAALLAAEQARKDYVAAHGYPDSIAVLDALFAMYDRRWDDVRAAVHRVDLAKDDDEEDLYLLYIALDSTGDHDAALAIRRRIEQNPPTWNVWRAWMKSDGDGTPAAQKRFSPRYPTGKRFQ